MRPSLLLVSLLLVSILLSEAQGIRLEKGFIPVGHQKIHEEGVLIKTSNIGGVGEVILCKDGHCSGNNRKLLTKTTSTSTTATTTSKNVKNGGNKADPISKSKSSDERLGGEEENFSANSSPGSEHREVAPEHYPDLLDIAGMDYSSAKRKPPIHN